MMSREQTVVEQSVVEQTVFYPESHNVKNRPIRSILYKLPTRVDPLVSPSSRVILQLFASETNQADNYFVFR